MSENPKWNNDVLNENVLRNTANVARNLKSLIEMEIHNRTVMLQDLVNKMIDDQEKLKRFSDEVNNKHKEAKDKEKKERKERINGRTATN